VLETHLVPPPPTRTDHRRLGKIFVVVEILDLGSRDDVVGFLWILLEAGKTRGEETSVERISRKLGDPARKHSRHGLEESGS